MAIISIERNEISEWPTSEVKTLVITKPKPRHLRGRVTVYVPDEVVRNKEDQPVINAYAGAVNKPDLIGKTIEQLQNEHHLLLGFHVVHFDDGADPQEWMDAQTTRRWRDCQMLI